MPDEPQVNPENPENQGDPNTNTLGWRAALPDEYKEHEWVKTFQKPGDFVKSAIEIKTESEALKSKLDGSIPKLPENASDEEKEAYYLSLGRPESADQYEITGDNLDETLVNWAKPMFYDLGLTKTQASKLVEGWNSFVQGAVDEQIQKRKTETENATKELRKEVGEKFDESVEGGRRAIGKLIPDEAQRNEFFKFLDESGLGNNPVLTRVFINAYKILGEDFTPPGSSSGQNDPAKTGKWDYPNSPKYPQSGY